MSMSIQELVRQRLGENYALHYRYLNRTLVQVQRMIGFDKVYARAKGAYLYDQEGLDYLDFLAGFGVFNIGRNHPAVAGAIREVLELDLPNMVQMDSALLSGLLAEALVDRFARQGAAHLDAVFLCNSGTEAVEGALKFARCATGRPKIICLAHSFHGLTYGSLSVTANEHFQEGFGPLLPGCSAVPLGDLDALERELRTNEVAAFLLEPVQGKGVYFADPQYYQEAQALCRRYGTLLVCDEVQTGLGRTGRWFGFEHWGLEPDIVTLAKSLSGGYVPCAAVVSRREIYQKVFSRLDRCVVHSTTFGRNNLACACGLATLKVIEEEGLVDNAARQGEYLRQKLQEVARRHELVGQVRVLGLMAAIEFQEPRALGMRTGWKLVHAVDRSLFAQLIVTALLNRYRILTQVAANNVDIVKILPPLVIGKLEVDRFVEALDRVLEEFRKFPGPLWEMGINFWKGVRAAQEA